MMWWLFTAMTLAGGTIEGTVELSRKKASPVIAYVDGEGPEIPELDRARVIQQGKAFHPEAVVVRQGAIVDFANEDIVFHHVYSRTPGNTFEIDEYGRNESKSVRFDEPGVVHVRCNKHSWMEATILVLPNAWYATADETGAFRIEGVEPGERTLVVWADGHQAIRTPITVEADGIVTFDTKLKKLPSGIEQGPQHLLDDGY